MSALESRINFTLEDILDALELRLELPEAIDKLVLTHALEQCLLYAQVNNLTNLANLVTQELDGYTDRPPSDRLVQLTYFDNGGQRIDGLSQYSSYPLATGTRKLELHLKNGLTLMLPRQILDFLSQSAGREVDSGHVSPAEINKLLNNIRALVVKKLKDIDC
jgi:hypothetical protein